MILNIGRNFVLSSITRYGNGMREIIQKAVLYDKLWREADEMTSEWSDEKQEYYFQVTD